MNKWTTFWSFILLVSLLGAKEGVGQATIPQPSRFSTELVELVRAGSVPHSLNKRKKVDPSAAKEVLERSSQSEDADVRRVAETLRTISRLDAEAAAHRQAYSAAAQAGAARMQGNILLSAFGGGDALADARDAIEKSTAEAAIHMQAFLDVQVQLNEATLACRNAVRDAARRADGEAPPTLGPFRATVFRKGEHAGELRITNDSDRSLHRCVLCYRLVPASDASGEMAGHTEVASGLMMSLGFSNSSIASNQNRSRAVAKLLSQERGDVAYIDELKPKGHVTIKIADLADFSYIDSADFSLWCDEGYIDNRPIDNWQGTTPEAEARYEATVAREDVLRHALESRAERVWRSNDGMFETPAQYVSHDARSVTLKKRDGATVVVPRSRLSQDDEDYLNSRSQP